MSQTNLKLFKKQLQACKYLFDPNWQGELCFGGAARGGKSFLGCSWIVSQAMAFPESNWLIGFEELKHLRRTTLPDLIKIIQIITEPMNGRNWKNTFHLNLQDLIIQFINGSKIFLAELANLPSDPNFDRLGSYSLTGVWIDEAQRVSIKAKSTLAARLSLTQGKGWKTSPKALYTCNPTRGWIYEDFWKPYKSQNPKEGKVFIQSLYTDNPAIDHEKYKKQILASGDKTQIERLLYGNFDYDSDDSKLFNYDKILDLFSNFIEKSNEKFITCDVARMGRDKTVIYTWQGWNAFERFEIKTSALTEIVNEIEKLREKHLISKSNVIVDEGGVGGGVVDFGGYKGFISNASPIQEDSKLSLEKKPIKNYNHLKTQCYFYLADMVNNSKMTITAQMDAETRENLIAELDTVKQHNIDKDGKLQVLPKDKQKELLAGRSPDDGDALMMRSYFDLKPTFKITIPN